jgi:uncharacterized protein (DUF3820 family)
MSNQFTSSARRQQRREHQAPSALADFPLAFGKYRNVPLSKIPTSYLRWMERTEGVPDADRWVAGQYLRAVAQRRRRRPGRRRGPGQPQETTTPALGSAPPV